MISLSYPRCLTQNTAKGAIRARAAQLHVCCGLRHRPLQQRQACQRVTPTCIASQPPSLRTRMAATLSAKAQAWQAAAARGPCSRACLPTMSAHGMSGLLIPQQLDDGVNERAAVGRQVRLWLPHLHARTQRAHNQGSAGLVRINCWSQVLPPAVAPGTGGRECCSMQARHTACMQHAACSATAAQ